MAMRSSVVLLSRHGRLQNELACARKQDQRAEQAWVGESKKVQCLRGAMMFDEIVAGYAWHSNYCREARASASQQKLSCVSLTAHPLFNANLTTS